MPTRIAFSTHWPDRMGEIAGKFTRFPEKLITMIDPYGRNLEVNDIIYSIEKSGVHDFNFRVNYSPKTTTIRKNYDYWKSKEGQLVQPFFWSGKPLRSKQVVFCPEVRLKRVRKITIDTKLKSIFVDHYVSEIITGTVPVFSEVYKHEGFDHPDHFWMWFDSDFEGALLELENVEG